MLNHGGIHFWSFNFIYIVMFGFHHDLTLLTMIRKWAINIDGLTIFLSGIASGIGDEPHHPVLSVRLRFWGGDEKQHPEMREHIRKGGEYIMMGLWWVYDGLKTKDQIQVLISNTKTWGSRHTNWWYNPSGDLSKLIWRIDDTPGQAVLELGQLWLFADLRSWNPMWLASDSTDFPLLCVIARRVSKKNAVTLW